MNATSTKQMLGRCLNCIHRTEEMVTPKYSPYGPKVYIRRFEKLQKACHHFKVMKEVQTNNAHAGTYHEDPKWKSENPRQDDLSINLPAEREHLCIGFTANEENEQYLIGEFEEAIIDGDIKKALEIGIQITRMPSIWKSNLTNSEILLAPKTDREKKDKAIWFIEITKAIKADFDHTLGLVFFTRYSEKSKRYTLFGNLSWWLVNDNSPFAYKGQLDESDIDENVRKINELGLNVKASMEQLTTEHKGEEIKAHEELLNNWNVFQSANTGEKKVSQLTKMNGFFLLKNNIKFEDAMEMKNK